MRTAKASALALLVMACGRKPRTCTNASIDISGASSLTPTSTQPWTFYDSDVGAVWDGPITTDAWEIGGSGQAIDLNTGEIQRWQATDESASYSLNARVDGRVGYFGGEELWGPGTVWARDLITGDELWRISDLASAHIALCDDRLISTLGGHDLQTGELLWAWPDGGEARRVYTLFDEHRVFTELDVPYQDQQLLSVRCGDGGDSGTPVANLDVHLFEFGSSFIPGDPPLATNVVTVGRDRYYLFDPVTGAILWDFPDVTESSNPHATWGGVSTDGRVILLEPGGWAAWDVASGALDWALGWDSVDERAEEIQGRSCMGSGQLAAHNGMVVIDSIPALVADASNGEIHAWLVTPDGNPVRGHPVFVDDQLVLLGSPETYWYDLSSVMP